LLQVSQRAKAFLVRAGTVIFGMSILIWAASTYPKDRALIAEAEGLVAKQESLIAHGNLAGAAAAEAQLAGVKSQQLARSLAGRAGHLIEPVIQPLGYDWKIGIGLIGSFAARELFVNTMAVVYAVGSGAEEDMTPLRDRIQQEIRPDGRPVYSPLVCLSLLVFYVFAMQCVSTMAIVKRETGSYGWMWFQLAYMSGTAYLLALGIYQIGTAMGY
jgi:ferrous iron transport protein B